MMPLRREHLAGHIVVWITLVSQAKDSLPFLEPYLDGGDRERAARFRFPGDRARFVLGRALLRKCLGHFLQQRPETIELAYTNLGRPILPGGESIQFSISHTQDLVAIAMTDGSRIGIDLERIQPHVDLPELAERIFSHNDLREFQHQLEREKLAAFFRAWTRKEAYLKARGEGIAEGLQQISVSFGPEETVPIVDYRDDSAAGTWHLMTLPVPEGYAGTLACDNISKRLDGAYVHFDKAEVVTESSVFKDSISFRKDR
jgi:4'-phosphopantetheinyl transferase